MSLPRQLNDPAFVLRVARMLSRGGLDAGRVTLEITEAAFGADAESMIESLHELKLLGVLLAIDDFGTEYSSLSKLRQLPIDVLKIDKSFVDGIATDPTERALTAAIVSLAASLGKGTVAEGIETEGQYAQLAGPRRRGRPGVPVRPATRPRRRRGPGCSRSGSGLPTRLTRSDSPHILDWFQINDPHCAGDRAARRSADAAWGCSAGDSSADGGAERRTRASPRRHRLDHRCGPPRATRRLPPGGVRLSCMR